MNVTTNHMKACMEAWLNCENLLIKLLQHQFSFSQRTTQVLDECANICLGTLQALKTGFNNVHELALLCVGICEECAEILERYTESSFQACAQVCRQCSSIFSPIAYRAM